MGRKRGENVKVIVASLKKNKPPEPDASLNRPVRRVGKKVR